MRSPYKNSKQALVIIVLEDIHSEYIVEDATVNESERNAEKNSVSTKEA